MLLRFVRPRDGRRFALCRGALRLILAQLRSRFLPRMWSSASDPGGKPELAARIRPGRHASAAVQCDALR